eukprot:CAMPEP_0174700154 /NCGR_PEP_ID=MMETSP1094-20130205/5196_1 /TAXON_ID=156173 /ORGANISM="Chrysochromulina brevifilum, Strain UTEX LB 985" /LENGTH=75 /DNA_ID=CAMNT_0015897591 /DNA_START=136 /DNA_END=363 /DNA_ORIENTATION=+
MAWHANKGHTARQVARGAWWGRVHMRMRPLWSMPMHMHMGMRIETIYMHAYEASCLSRLPAELSTKRAPLWERQR